MTRNLSIGPDQFGNNVDARMMAENLAFAIRCLMVLEPSQNAYWERTARERFADLARHFEVPALEAEPVEEPTGAAPPRSPELSEIVRLSRVVIDVTARAERAEADLRPWRYDVDEAPRDRVIEVCGRVRSATSGFPQYASWNDKERAFCASAYRAESQLPLVIWAWRERGPWSQEPQEPGR